MTIAMLMLVKFVAVFLVVAGAAVLLLGLAGRSRKMAGLGALVVAPGCAALYMAMTGGPWQCGAACEAAPVVGAQTAPVAMDAHVDARPAMETGAVQSPTPVQSPGSIGATAVPPELAFEQCFNTEYRDLVGNRTAPPSDFERTAMETRARAGCLGEAARASNATPGEVAGVVAKSIGQGVPAVTSAVQEDLRRGAANLRANFPRALRRP